MKMFIAFALLIATVAALPMETAERSTKQLVAQAEGEAAEALSKIVADVKAIDTELLEALAVKVEGVEDNVAQKITDLQEALNAAA